METFEQKIANAVNEKLNDGTVERLVEKYIEKGVSDALSNVFSYGGEGKKLLEKKFNEIIIPVIERHDFNRYLIKLDAVLTEIVEMTSLSDNKEILENFGELMRQPEIKEINLSEVFKHYCKHVEKNVSTDDLEACCDDGEPYYECVTAQMEVEHREKMFRSDYDDCIVKFTCDEDAGLNCQIKLFKRTDSDKWRMLGNDSGIDISSLRDLSDFQIFLMTLKRAFVKIVMDKEDDYEDSIEPEEKPEWSLS